MLYENIKNMKNIIIKRGLYMTKGLKNRNILFSLIAALFLTGVLSGCRDAINETKKEHSSVSKETVFNSITHDEAKKRLRNEKDIILLDVRTQDEYDSGHIKDSILIPVDKLKKEAENNLKDKDATIFVYCRSGNRSTTAAKILVDLGY